MSLTDKSMCITRKLGFHLGHIINTVFIKMQIQFFVCLSEKRGKRIDLVLFVEDSLLCSRPNCQPTFLKICF